MDCNEDLHCSVCHFKRNTVYLRGGGDIGLKRHYWLRIAGLPEDPSVVVFSSSNKDAIVWDTTLEKMEIGKQLEVDLKHSARSPSPFGLHRAQIKGTNETVMMKFSRVSMVLEFKSVQP